MLKKSIEEPQDLTTRSSSTERSPDRQTSSSFISSPVAQTYFSDSLKPPFSMPIKQETLDNNFDNAFRHMPAQFKSVKMESMESNEFKNAAARKERAFMPDNRKDDCYWMKRRKNNEAAKRSREKRRAIDSMLENTVVVLNEENSRLKRELELFKEGKIMEIPKLSNTASPPVAHIQVKETINDQIGRNYDLINRNAHGLISFGGMPSICSEQYISQVVNRSKQVYYPVSSLNATSPFETNATGAFFQNWPCDSKVGIISKGHFHSDEPVTKKLKVDCTDYVISTKTDLVHSDIDNNSDDASKSDGDVSQRSSPLSLGRLSPTHSAFASGIDAKRLPYKLRAKVGALSPTQMNTPDSPKLTSDIENNKSLSRDNLERFNADDNTQSDLCSVRLQIGGICTPPSSNTSEDIPIVENAQKLPAITVEKRKDTHSIEIKQEPLDWNDNIESSDAEATRLSRDRMLKAAQALTEMEASEEKTTAEQDDQSTKMLSSDTKYWEKRRRNNLAARKCRESKRLLHEYRCARASYLEHENNQLHSEISMLTKDVTNLKEMLKAKQLRVA
ncbi:uncharacterized protein [Antedon mediterranea]